MMNKGVAIRYGNVAPEAKENFVPTSNQSEFDNLDQLQKYNLKFSNYSNPCELYQTVLDGNAVPFPSNPKKTSFGFLSNQISKEDGYFEKPIILELESEGNYSSPGLTLTFDTYNNIFSTRINIKWYGIRNEELTLLDEKDFLPNSSIYFCDNNVEFYKKIIITFYSLNMPQNRLKLRSIDYGKGTVFYGNELRSTKIIQEIDLISSQIIINTADFVIDSKGDAEISFQVRQPLSIYFNGQLKATTFIKSSKRKSQNLWDVQSEDYIGLMDSIPYYGGIYNNEYVTNILADIFEVANVPYSLDDIFSKEKVTGYIPYTTCRDALMQVAFAIQAVVDTSNSDIVNIFKINETANPQKIPLKRIMQGQNFVKGETVTSVELTYHSYVPIEETLDAYIATESGTGENIFVKFSEPLHDLKIGQIFAITDENGQKIFRFVEDNTVGNFVSFGANYAIINASNEGFILKGKKYDHIKKVKSQKNNFVLAIEPEKIISIESATLVSNDNVDKTLKSCYNWLVRNRTTNLKIVEGKHVYQNSVIYDTPVNVGEQIQVETEYLGNVSGILTKQSFNLNGNIIVKEAVIK